MNWFGQKERIDVLMSIFGFEGYGDAGIVVRGDRDESTYSRYMRQMIREEILKREDELKERESHDTV